MMKKSITKTTGINENKIVEQDVRKQGMADEDIH